MSRPFARIVPKESVTPEQLREALASWPVIRYLAVLGDDAERSEALVRARIDTYTDEELDGFAATAATPADRIRALHYQALAARPDHDARVAGTVESALQDPDHRVRGAAILAAAYLEWPALVPRLRELAQSDPDELVRRDAAQLAEVLSKRQVEEAG